MFYDVRFDAIAPKSADSTEQEEVIRLIINVEAQTKFKPGYPLTKRAIYYCSRMISVQHGPIFTKSEYGKIRKVYSIWICTQPSDGFENTLTRYSIKPEQLIGEAQEETENYDLKSVVMICLGKPGTENHKGMGINRSGYYKWKSRQGKLNRYEQDRILLTQLLHEEHELHPCGMGGEKRLRKPVYLLRNETMPQKQCANTQKINKNLGNI